mmetsp:Transcript_25698/g.59254  ORF Transcript_25698/g.59254 Transcript_25698/m.59254 type:complete len:106 (+) Transcript_25698:2-319(+)
MNRARLSALLLGVSATLVIALCLIVADHTATVEMEEEVWWGAQAKKDYANDRSYLTGVRDDFAKDMNADIEGVGMKADVKIGTRGLDQARDDAREDHAWDHEDDE